MRMLWYLLVALDFFALAMFSAYFHAHTERELRYQVVLHSKCGLALLLLNLVCFYPLVVAYFKLYPVSSPRHFAATLLGWSLTVNGLALAALSRWCTQLQPLPTLLHGLKRRRGIKLLAIVLGWLVAPYLLSRDMASGSLLSIWSLLFILVATAVNLGTWSLLFQLPASRKASVSTDPV